MVQKVMKEMIAYYAGDPARIQHFLKVYEFSRMIGLAEGLDGNQQLTLELAADHEARICMMELGV